MNQAGIDISYLMSQKELMTAADPNTIRDSVLFHLNTFNNMGLSDCLKQPPAAEAKQKPDIQTPLAEVSDLQTLQNQLDGCTRCKLCEKRNTIVFGEGNPNAQIMFIGEGPGADEDEQGLPFVGKAGQLLTKIIEAMGLSRNEVYIANVVKCRPPGNRNPEPEEITSCMPFLQKQIELIQPQVILCLGKFAAQTILETHMPISKIRGQFYEKNGMQIMPVFHPAYLLRNPNMKRVMWEDCKKVMELIK